MSVLLAPMCHRNKDDVVGWLFWCPGCKCHHPMQTKAIPGNDLVWSFNGDHEFPTFAPSLICNKSIPDKRCHLYVRNGQIQFLSDCYHELAGKTVPMEPHDWGTE